MKCQEIKPDGTQCRANAMHNSSHCFRHNKNTMEHALRASSNGGQAKRQYDRLGNRLNIQTPTDIKKLMAKSINALWLGKMSSSNPAGALGYLAKVFLEAHGKSELETRIGALEKRLDQANPS